MGDRWGMLFVERAWVDHARYTHASVERRARERYEHVEITPKQDIVATPFMLESSFNLDTELARSVGEILASWLIGLCTRRINDADKDTAAKILSVDFMRM